MFSQACVCSRGIGGVSLVPGPFRGGRVGYPGVGYQGVGYPGGGGHCRSRYASY